MISDRYIPTLNSMSYKIHKVLSYKDNRFPIQGQKIYEASSYGYEVLYNMSRLFHSFLVIDSTILSPDFPRQGKTKSFDSWARKASFHCALLALVHDDVFDLGTPKTPTSTSSEITRLLWILLSVKEQHRIQLIKKIIRREFFSSIFARFTINVKRILLFLDQVCFCADLVISIPQDFIH